MDELYQKKYNYERLINSLSNNVARIESCYMNLINLRKKINNNFSIDNKPFSYNEIDRLIKELEKIQNNIRNNILPQARYQYNNILYAISKS